MKRLSPPNFLRLAAGLILMCMLPSFGQPDAQRLRAIYEQKQELFSSYRVQYTIVRNKFTPEKSHLGATTTRYVHVSSGPRYLYEQFKVESGSDRGVLRRRRAFDGHKTRTISYAGEDNPPIMGSIETTSSAEAHLSQVFSIPALVGLKSSKTQPDGERFYPASQGADMMCLLADPAVSILPDYEMIDGYKCWVVHAGALTAWLAEDLGYALIKRESRIAFPEGEELILRVRCHDFREMQPGFYFPHAITCDNGPRAQARIGEIAVEEYKVESLELMAKVSDADLHLEFPEGMIVEDKGSGKRYMSGEAN